MARVFAESEFHDIVERALAAVPEIAQHEVAAEFRPRAARCTSATSAPSTSTRAPPGARGRFCRPVARGAVFGFRLEQVGNKSGAVLRHRESSHALYLGNLPV